MPSASAPQSSLGGPRDTMVAAMANPSSDIRLSRQSNTDSCGDAGSSVGMTRTSRSELSGYDMNGSSEHGDPSIGKALELKMEADTTFSPAFKVSPPTPPRPMYPSQRPVAPHACMGNSGRMEAEDVKPGAEDRAGNRTQYVGTGRTPGDERFAERFGDRLGDRFGDRFCDRHSDSSGVSIGDLHSERSSSSFTRTPALRADDKLGGRSSMDGGGRVEAQQDLSVKQGSKSSEADEEVDSRAGSSPSQSNGRVAQIAEGLLWVQKHPVLAAVVWVVGKVLAPGSEEEVREQGFPKKHEEGRKPHPSAHAGRAAINAHEKGGAQPSLSRKHSSKGRLSWSDENGGCLAEYFEDNREPLASDSTADGAHSCISIYPRQFERTHLDSNGQGVGPFHSSEGSETGAGREDGIEGHERMFHGGNIFYQDMTDAMRGRGEETAGAACANDAGESTGETGESCQRSPDDSSGFLPRVGQLPGSVGVAAAQHTAQGTWSPQWGWYVSMTPPQDLYPTQQAPVGAGKITSPGSSDTPDGHNSNRRRPSKP